MDDQPDNNSFFIEAYFEDLEQRFLFLKKLDQEGHKDEALMLCCCYIEAIGSRKYRHSKNKAFNYSKILGEYGGNQLFPLVHPGQLISVLNDKNLFSSNLIEIDKSIKQFKNTLQTQATIADTVSPILTTDQNKWLTENIFKGTMAYISYDLVRCELVHDISAGGVTFSQTTHNGAPVPDLDFNLLYDALFHIFNSIKKESTEANKWFWEL